MNVPHKFVFMEKQVMHQDFSVKEKRQHYLSEYSGLIRMELSFVGVKKELSILKL
jgi:hypothetical protein